MTGKRFECDKGSRIIIDNETKLHYIMTLDWECSLVTKLLNRFAEENEQLKHKLQQQEMEYATDLHRLAEENEQCKMMIATLRNIILENGIDIE